MNRTTFAGHVFLAIALFAPHASVWPQAYPTRPVRLVVPFAPGGPADIAARTFGTKLGEVLGQTFVTDNRPGGGGVLGAEILARAKPDGYTLLICSTSVLVINPIVSPKLSYDPDRDFALVSLITSSPYLVLIHPGVPANNIKELIALAKAKPGTLNFGSAGTRSTSHLVGEIFKASAGIDITHIAYKGSAVANADLVAGHLQMAFESVASGLPNVTAGRLRALGISTLQRFPLTPNIPTVHEAGLPGYEAATWQGVCAPAGTPQPIIATLNRAFAQVARSPDVGERLASLGAQAIGNTPQEFAAFLKMEIPRWTKAIQLSGAKPQ